MGMTPKTRANVKSKGRAYVREILEKASCMDCGYKNWTALQFDHREPSLKSFEMSKMSGRSFGAVKAEVAKCDIVCANCHLIRTANMFGSWRLGLEYPGYFDI